MNQHRKDLWKTAMVEEGRLDEQEPTYEGDGNYFTLCDDDGNYVTLDRRRLRLVGQQLLEDSRASYEGMD